MDILEDLDVLRTFRNDIEEIRGFNSRRMRMIRRPKQYKKRMNPLQDLSESDFRQRYRFSKANMLKIIDILRNDLRVDRCGGSIPVELQVMSVIRYWGRHEIQEDCADIHGMSQQTLSYLSKKVGIALASKSSIYIQMPLSLRAQIFRLTIYNKNLNPYVDSHMLLEP
ncbi:uncharacterized protein LOC124645450 [Helicoverpa zea]|uniref:uncharacterized protein LOC124645450 n=1 Tax=Helicoverpa zea TaxID=7113 RepID=UPI001F55F4C2|nr:uncharacterized protein LOC124645450 [Helicoverpa zea]